MSSDSEYASEAVKSLGLPDSPVIHLSIHTVAGLLRPLESRSLRDARSTCIARFRVASSTVLEGLPIEHARYEFLSRVGVEGDSTEADEAYRTRRTDWLGQAKEQLAAQGLDTGPDARPMATRYGWNPTPRGR